MMRLTYNEIMDLADKVDSIRRMKQFGLLKNFEPLVEIKRGDAQELVALFHIKPEPIKEITFTIGEADK